jgi:predicted AAA+ superfamily ATPase
MLGVRRGVNLTGARQTGKSTLAGIADLPKSKRYTFDDKFVRDIASTDPNGFVEHGKGETVVIDEIQKVPDILEAIKMVVDKDSSPGQYLLTGSSNLRFAKAVRDSLAGRFGRIRLRTLAQGEINGGEPTFLRTAFNRDFDSFYADFTRRDVIHAAFRGGYPEILDYTPQDRTDWFETYLDDLLEKDIQEVTEIRKLPELRATALWLLAHTAQFFSVEELSAKASISKITAQNYMAALEALYLFDSIPAWTKSEYEMVGKREKWFATDSALVASLLGWNESEVYMDENRNGKLVETWVYQQLAAIAEVEGGYTISHYRDNRKREIDFMVERKDGAVLGVEVKAGQASLSDFKHLKWFAANLAKKPFTGIVLYSGDKTLRFGDGLYAVPLSALG